jgi:hypothetical protein
LGSGIFNGRSETLPTGLLTRHTAIFAGSGSGKTVLLRRIVEEAALLGIPAIVIDTNNDLARLGELWPVRPTAFSDDDAQHAQRYKQTVEVVVWTPGLAGGRALNLAVLPDFTVITDEEEREQAVDMAWATLVPLIRATGSTKDLKEGLLKDALRAFARRPKGGIDGFISFIADLPDGVSKLTKAQKLASDMSDQLIAKIAVNPLLNAAGQKLDPATLFVAKKSGKTRISVINFSGLHADASRQDFVNQLQMALFTFIRKHPTETPRLYVLDEAQNFAPSAASTPTANDIQNLRVKAGNGTTTPIGTVAEIKQVQGPSLISLYNLYPSATVVGNAGPGFSSGEALDLMDQIGEHALPSGTGYEWTAMSYQEKAVGSQIYFVFALALLLVYFVLAGQYESWILPLSVILGVPLALLGTVSALTILGAANDLYTRIGLVLLIALGSKNAILVVEYARQRRAEGMEIITAAVEGARLRFRPILMTSFAFILGVFPLVIATGAGAGARRSIGLAVFSGMIASTCLVVVFVPSFYVVMQRIQERWTRRAVPNNPPAPPHPNAL